MLLIDYARELGLPCRGRIQGSVVTWTTDHEKATALQRVGASYTRIEATSGRVIGYEVHFAPDREVTSVLLSQ